MLGFRQRKEFLMSNEKATGRIRIVKLPRGEAPEWVRKAWIGIELLCYPHPNCTINLITGKHDLVGALSGRPVAPYFGYDVPTTLAIRALARKNQKAAKWWREHGYPKEYFDFHFEDECAEEMSGIKRSVLVDDMETGRWEAPGER